jgi:hypothetical protein
MPIQVQDNPIAPPNSPTFEHPMNIRSWPSTDLKDISLPDLLPKGTVTPNGLPWGHSPRHFFNVALPSADPVMWSKSMIEEAWGKDVFAKGRLAEEDEEADKDVRELTPRLRRPWPVLGISRRTNVGVRRSEDEVRKIAHLGVIDEGSDHEGELQMRDDDERDGFQMEGDEMLEEIRGLVLACSACTCDSTCSSRSENFSHLVFSFLFFG